MIRNLFLIVVLSQFLSNCFSQQTSDNWAKWSWLIGDWVGEGSGQPGQGGGIFSFSFDLDKKILIRKSHSEYPAIGNKPKVIHDDLMIIYPDFSGVTGKAIYFDNEGHVINYIVTFQDRSIVMTSEKVPNTPTFRLTYSLLKDDTVNTKFEMSQEGEKFITYIEGISKKRN